MTAAATLVGATYATSALADGPMLTKAPPAPAATASCGSFYDFFFSACPLTWYGVTVYGTVDAGVGYETHGAPFNPQQPAGQAYFLQKVNRQSMWGLAPNAMSQSNIGVKITEPIGGGWNFVSQLEFGFDPYGFQAANGPGSVFNNRGIPLAAESTNGDSSRAGQFYNSVGYLGVSSNTFGTLTFFRQNALTLDGVLAYDPMGGAYAFSPIGWSGQTCGVGDTEDCRISTAAKYRVNVGPIRLAALAQIGGYGQNNASTADYEAQIGGDIANLAGGVLSLDGIYSWVKDAVGVAVFTGSAALPMAATISNDQSFMALAKYHNGPLNLYGGFEWISYANPSDPQTAFTDIAGNFVCGTTAAPCGNNTAIVNAVTTSGVKTVYVAWTGVKYAVTKNLDVIGAYYHYTQPQFAATGANACTAAGATPFGQAGCFGTMDAYSAVIDWRFLPKWDTYLGFMFSQVNGGLATGYQVRNNFDPTVGVRFRF
ncbi:MAG: porin [Hyphomicrobiales bacterium]|nr:porin [Hyphomicrobiales bacterium]MDE2284508.1 porin [Hyphomicrobiales bacterium]